MDTVTIGFTAMGITTRDSYSCPGFCKTDIKALVECDAETTAVILREDGEG